MLLVDCWNAWAVPWNDPCAVCGRLSSRCVCWITLTASESAMPGSRLNEIVTDGSCPR